MTFIGHVDPIFGSNDTPASLMMALFATADLTKPDSYSINANYSSDEVRGKVKGEVKRAIHFTFLFVGARTQLRKNKAYSLIRRRNSNKVLTYNFPSLARIKRGGCKAVLSEKRSQQ
jgi:hypothetical protein